MLIRAAPLLLGAMVSALIGMAVWGFRRSRANDEESAPQTRDDVLLGFMLLAAVALATFLVYLMVILGSR